MERIPYAESITQFYSGGYAELTDEERFAEDRYGITLVFPESYETEPDFEQIQDKFKWDIRYFFTGNVRNHIMYTGKRYGGKDMTFRRLFLILVKANNGVDFIQEYINKELPYSYAGEKLQEYLDNAMAVVESRFAQELVTLRRTRKGKVDRRQKRKLRQLAQYSASVNTEVAEWGEEVARIIKEDIEAKAMCGQLQLNPPNNAESTMLKREQVGLLREPRYYASGQFFEDLHIVCKLEKKEWLTDINILE